MGQRYVHLVIDTNVQPNDVLHVATWRFRAQHLRAAEIRERGCDPDSILMLSFPLKSDRS